VYYDSGVHDFLGNIYATNSIYGGNAASGNLNIDSTANGTKGYVTIQPSGGNVGMGTATPYAVLHTNAGDNTGTTYPMLFNNATQNSYVNNNLNVSTLTAPAASNSTLANADYVTVTPGSALTLATVYGRYTSLVVPSAATYGDTGTLQAGLFSAENYGSGNI